MPHSIALREVFKFRVVANVINFIKSGGGKGCGKKPRFDVSSDKFTVPTKPYCSGYKHKCEGKFWFNN